MTTTKRVSFNLTHSGPVPVYTAPTPLTKSEAWKWYLFYDELWLETLTLLDKIREDGPLPNLLLFNTTKDSQLNFYEEKLEHYLREREWYLLQAIWGFPPQVVLPGEHDLKRAGSQHQ